VILVGQLVDGLGCRTETRAVASGPPSAGRSFDVETRRFLAPISLRSVQRTVPLDLDHDHSRRIGRVEYLRETEGGNVWMVGSLDRGVPPGPLYLSPEYSGPPDDVTLLGAALTARPSMKAMPPVRIFPEGDLLDLDERALLLARRLDPFLGDLLAGAAAAVRERRYGRGDLVRVAKPPPKVERIGTRSWIVDDELVSEPVPAASAPYTRRPAPRYAGPSFEPGYGDEDRPVGPLLIRPSKILAVR
jgi:hypothetical protein